MPYLELVQNHFYTLDQLKMHVLASVRWALESTSCSFTAWHTLIACGGCHSVNHCSKPQQYMHAVLTTKLIDLESRYFTFEMDLLVIYGCLHWTFCFLSDEGQDTLICCQATEKPNNLFRICGYSTNLIRHPRIKQWCVQVAIVNVIRLQSLLF